MGSNEGDGSQIDLSAVADAVEKAVIRPPPALANGWFAKRSNKFHGYVYYFHSDTGQTTWTLPRGEASERIQVIGKEVVEPHNGAVGGIIARKPSMDASVSRHGDSKRRRMATPDQVRVLHILKKHRDSRRPSSWRQGKVSISSDEAREELLGLRDILEGEQSPEDLKATFEEIARTESDCSSAKHGGDLGYFGRKKMQPEFEEASFSLSVGEMTHVPVQTSSGLHLILRIA